MDCGVVVFATLTGLTGKIVTSDSE
jgi:hypothetical protein